MGFAEESVCDFVFLVIVIIICNCQCFSLFVFFLLSKLYLYIKEQGYKEKEASQQPNLQKQGRITDPGRNPLQKHIKNQYTTKSTTKEPNT
jgi:hypothetical protein